MMEEKSCSRKLSRHGEREVKYLRYPSTLDLHTDLSTIDV